MLTPDSFSVSIALSDKSAGLVKINPEKSKYKSGDIIQLIAKANDNYYFAGWSGSSTITDPTKDTISLSVTSNLNLTAMFLPFSKFTVLKAVSPVNSSEIILSPNGQYYQKGAIVKAIAKPSTGYRIVKWAGANTSANDTISLSIETNVQIQAQFELIYWKLQIETNPINGGTVSARFIESSYNGKNCQWSGWDLCHFQKETDLYSYNQHIVARWYSFNFSTERFLYRR